MFYFKILPYFRNPFFIDTECVVIDLILKYRTVTNHTYTHTYIHTHTHTETYIERHRDRETEDRQAGPAIQPNRAPQIHPAEESPPA